jgi:hypothetical protein
MVALFKSLIKKIGFDPNEKDDPDTHGWTKTTEYLHHSSPMWIIASTEQVEDDTPISKLVHRDIQVIYAMVF